MDFWTKAHESIKSWIDNCAHDVPVLTVEQTRALHDAVQLVMIEAVQEDRQRILMGLAGLPVLSRQQSLALEHAAVVVRSTE